MHDFRGYQRSAIRYWERRRIVFNLVLFPPAVFSFLIVGGIEAGLGGVPVLTDLQVLIRFIGAAIGANVCYSFAYVLEFWFGSDSPESGWLHWGRTAVLVTGVLCAIVLATFGGAAIACRQYGVHP